MSNGLPATITHSLEEFAQFGDHDARVIRG